jgi:hypothetical protein
VEVKRNPKAQHNLSKPLASRVMDIWHMGFGHDFRTMTKANGKWKKKKKKKNRFLHQGV